MVFLCASPLYFFPSCPVPFTTYIQQTRNREKVFLPSMRFSYWHRRSINKETEQLNQGERDVSWLFKREKSLLALVAYFFFFAKLDLETRDNGKHIRKQAKRMLVKRISHLIDFPRNASCTNWFAMLGSWLFD